MESDYKNVWKLIGEIFLADEPLSSETTTDNVNI